MEGSDGSQVESAQVDTTQAAEQAPAGDPGQPQDAGTQAPPAGQAQATDWTTQPLPQGHPLAPKYKTLGDWHKAYESSGQEGRRLYSENQRLQAQMLEIQRQQQQPQPAGRNKDAFWGFGSKENLARAMQEDFEGTQAAIIQKELEKRLATHLAPIQDQLESSRHAAQFQSLVGKYPDAAPGQPGNEAAAAYVNRNPWLIKVAREDPSFDPMESAYKLATFELMAQKLAGAEKRLAEFGKRSQAARPGTGAPKRIVQDNSSESAIDAAVEDARAAGEEVPESMILAAKRSAKRHLNI